MKKFKVITMIGSMKFLDIMLSEEIRLTDKGYIVIHPCKSGYNNIPEKLKAQYDDEIRAKIDLADIVYVIDVNKYIGKSTKDEIEYAKNKNKKIFYYSDDYNMLKDTSDKLLYGILCNPNYITPSVNMIGSRKFKNIFDYANKTLTSYGFNVKTPSIFLFEPYEIDKFSREQHEILDKNMNFNIQHSTDILLVDGNIGDESYVGQDTLIEVDFAANVCNRHIYQTTKNGI